jgi:hypothetical protein
MLRRQSTNRVPTYKLYLIYNTDLKFVALLVYTVLDQKYIKNVYFVLQVASFKSQTHFTLPNNAFQYLLH